MNNGISIITPFYKGNKFLNRLFRSINSICDTLDLNESIELVLVNDSPEVKLEIPDVQRNFDLHIIINEKNLGIQGARINGLKQSKGEWIVFLDQDDELNSEGYTQQLALRKSADIIVGNGLYQFGSEKKRIFKNIEEMEYLIRKEMFIKIRNLIPSPGECLIKKEKIPELWIDNQLRNNGADDWLLWIMLFQNNCAFACNSDIVYIHNDAEGKNLSLDLDKMYESSEEMLEILKNNRILKRNELEDLENAIKFKYLQDTKKIKINTCFKYRKQIVNNAVYKINRTIR